MMGGRGRILEEAEKAYNEKDYQWSAELVTYIIRLDKNDMEARKLKAAALRHVGYGNRNAQYRHWCLTAARELEGILPEQHKRSFDASDVIRFYPPDFIIRMVTSQLRAEETLDVRMTLGVVITDSGENIWLEIRNGVAILNDRAPDPVDVTIEMTRDLLNKTKFQPEKTIEAVNGGALTVKGSKEDTLRFFNYFENLGDFKINMSIH